ncbi:MAG TPA: M28 family metallopeptidase [Gemmatimonadota bacterium]|nr:M28 family metallopeptidase [Gemmatimonadota bacterium]
MHGPRSQTRRARHVARLLATGLLSVVGVLLTSPALLSAQAADEAPPESAMAVIRPEAVRAHMLFLADDLLEGRGPGTRGYDLAARYVATRFEALGLEPAGSNGSYYQPVPLRRLQLIPEESGVELIRSDERRALKPFEEFVMFGDPAHLESHVEAPLVFAGYGVTAPELGYDDYGQTDVRGKIVVLLWGAPPTFPSAERAHFSFPRSKQANAARRGAIGILQVWTEHDERRTPWRALTRFSRTPGMRWLSPDGVPNEARPELQGQAIVSTETSTWMFLGAEKSFDEAVAAAQRSEPQAFPLDARASIRMASRHESFESPNIVGLLRGSDPSLAREFVVYTAHLDHEGIGEPFEGDSIYNGALDNASGVAQMLEVADAFTRLPQRPRRSVVFLAVTGEERGLLGSDYFVNYPTVPIEQIVANINLDGGLILVPPADVVLLGADHSTLGAIAESAAGRLHLEVTPDPAPEQTFFIRSDQYSFVRQGIPAVFPFPGTKSSDPEIDAGARLQQYLTERYHKPSDDMSQAFSYEAGAIGARLNFAIGYAVAQRTERPRWNPGDFFGRTFASD